MSSYKPNKNRWWAASAGNLSARGERLLGLIDAVGGLSEDDLRRREQVAERIAQVKGLAAVQAGLPATPREHVVHFDATDANLLWDAKEVPDPVSGGGWPVVGGVSLVRGIAGHDGERTRWRCPPGPSPNPLHEGPTMRRRPLLAALALATTSLATVLGASATTFADAAPPRQAAHSQPAAQPGLHVPACAPGDNICKCDAYKAIQNYYLQEADDDASMTPAESVTEDSAAAASGLAAARPCSL